MRSGTILLYKTLNFLFPLKDLEGYLCPEILILGLQLSMTFTEKMIIEKISLKAMHSGKVMQVIY